MKRQQVTCKLFAPDGLTVNNRLYTSACLEKMCEEFNASNAAVPVFNGPSVGSKEVIGHLFGLSLTPRKEVIGDIDFIEASYIMAHGNVTMDLSMMVEDEDIVDVGDGIKRVDRVAKVMSAGIGILNEDMTFQPLERLVAYGKKDISDGYHTFGELYDHRNIIFLNLMKQLPELSWYSFKHSDGTMFDGCLVCGMNLPQGQITYHMKIEMDKTVARTGAQFLRQAPEFDGHTPQDVVARLGAFLIEGGIPDEESEVRHES